MARLKARFRPILSLVLAVCLTVCLVPGEPALARTMNSSVPIAAGNGPKGVAVGDVNGDGLEDIVVADFRGTTFKVLLQGAGGAAETATDVPLPAHAAVASVKIGDITGDGLNDIVIGDTWAQSLHVYAGDGSSVPMAATYTIPTYTSGRTAPGPVSNPFDFAMADATGDGQDDLVVPRYYHVPADGSHFPPPDPDTGGFMFLQGPYAGSFNGFFMNTPTASGGSVGNPYAAVIGRLDDDLSMDIGLAGFKSGAFTPFYAPGFVSAPDVRPNLGTAMVDVDMGDFNGDSHQDVAAIRYNATDPAQGSLSIALQNSISRINQAPTQELDTGEAPTSMAVGDVNGDGLDDVAVVNSYNAATGVNHVGTVGVFIQDASGLLQPMREFEVGRQPYGCAIGDVDSDDAKEIVVANEVDDTLQILRLGDPLPPTLTSPTWPTPANWVNQTKGSMIVSAPPDFDGIAGFYYGFDRSFASTPSPLIADFTTVDKTTGVAVISYDVSLSPLAVPTADGDWYFHARTKDVLGNVSPTATYRIRIDTHAPTRPVVAPLASWTADPSLPLSWSSSTDALSGFAGYIVYLNGAEYARTTETRMTLNNLKEGLNAVGVASYDRAGNLSARSTGTINVDSIAPTVSITVPSSDEQVFGSQPTFSAVATDAAGVQRVEFLVDGVPKRTVTSPPYRAALNLGGLADGAHTLTVNAYDHFRLATESRGFVLDAAPRISSSTWPNPADWRRSTAGSLLVTSAVDPSAFSGYRYRFDRTPNSLPTLLDRYALANTRSDTVFAHEFRFDPLAVPTVDGDWYFHVRTDDGAGNLGSASHVHIMIDTTAPTVPTLDALPSGWRGTAALPVSWRRSNDGLSGLATYITYVNGGEALRTTLNDAVPVSDLHQGANTIAVAALDRAGSLSARSTGTIKVDSIAPTVSIISPRSGATVGGHPAFAAKPADGAGISKVVFRVDGRTAVTLTRAPWNIYPDLTKIPAGSHVLRVTAYDMIAHTASASSRFVLDNRAPGLTVRSVGPTPFFPKLRDGYIDNTYFKFSLGEAAKVTFRVTNSRGALVRKIVSAMKPGTRQFTWDGKMNNGSVAVAGNYGLRVSASDAYGNASWTRAYGVQIRYFILSRLASNKVRVILH